MDIIYDIFSFNCKKVKLCGILHIEPPVTALPANSKFSGQPL